MKGYFTPFLTRCRWNLSPLGKNKEKKGELNMEEQEKPQCHFCMGLLIGGAIGALAGILFAAKSGKELRSDIKGKVSEVVKDAEDIYADSSTKAKAIFEEAKHQAKELKKDADRHLSEARQNANGILASTGGRSACASTRKKGDAGEAAEVSHPLAGGTV
jgi:gas vesicle protein